MPEPITMTLLAGKAILTALKGAKVAKVAATAVKAAKSSSAIGKGAAALAKSGTAAKAVGASKAVAATTGLTQSQVLIGIVGSVGIGAITHEVVSEMRRTTLAVQSRDWQSAARSLVSIGNKVHGLDSGPYFERLQDWIGSGAPLNDNARELAEETVEIYREIKAAER